MDSDPFSQLRHVWPERGRPAEQLVELQPQIAMMARLQPEMALPGVDQAEQAGGGG
jgi:hypothetical protein